MADGPKTTHTPKDSHYAQLRRAYRDRQGAAAGGGQGAPAPQDRGTSNDQVRLYGLHTVTAALGNPRRRVHRLAATRNALLRLGLSEEGPHPFALEIVAPRSLDAALGAEAVHQGAMLEVDPLPPASLADVAGADVLLVLDQVTDPHNVGAILRSAAAFGAGGLVTTARHSPQESGVLAKAASGALELVPYVQIVNLADALKDLEHRGFQTIGLDSDGERELEASFAGRRIALVLGSEGKGLRQKTRETVTAVARLAMPGAIRSLNVSNAAAVALYAARRFLA